MKHTLLISALLITACAALEVPAPERLAAGKSVVVDRNQGNCLACHKIADGEMPGNIGPELNRQRLHSKSKPELRALIWDASRFNPKTSMPPYGRNKVLADDDINKIVDYLWQLP